MTLKTSGALSFADVNIECGRAEHAEISMSWIRSNSYYLYHDLQSLYGLAYFQAKSSQNIISRSSVGTATNCRNDCETQQPANDASFTVNCDSISTSNCDQCSYMHGESLIQPNCNCNCNCSNCNCRYNNCITG